MESDRSNHPAGVQEQQSLRVLIVEDSYEDTMLLVAMLRRAGYVLEYRRVCSASSMDEALNGDSWDIVFSDHSMPDFSSTEALSILKRKRLDIPFIIVSGTIDEEMAVEAMQSGANDYILKDNLKRLVPAVERELHEASERRKRREAEKKLLAEEEELRIAKNIQRGLFPSSAPELPGYDIAGVSRPANVTGGDYFDFIRMPGGRIGIVVGDVAGHGLGPALLMAEARECLRTLALTSSDLCEILNRADLLLSDDFGGDRFISLMIAKLSPGGEGVMEYINAGNPTAYVLSADGGIAHELGNTSPVIGLNIGSGFVSQACVRLRAGELVVIMSDGVLETASPVGEMFGTGRALDAVKQFMNRPAAEIVGSICHAVEAFRGGAPQEDDVTVVAIKTCFK